MNAEFESCLMNSESGEYVNIYIITTFTVLDALRRIEACHLVHCRVGLFPVKQIQYSCAVTQLYCE